MVALFDDDVSFLSSIYDKLIEFVEIDEKGTNYPPVSSKIQVMSMFQSM